MMCENVQTDYILDTVGKFCPAPIIETTNKIKRMDAGETLLIISDDAEFKSDIINWCRVTGNKFLGDIEKDGEIEVYIRKVVV